MRHLALLAALIATPASAGEIIDRGFHYGGYRPAAPHELEVRFGSFCCGPDRTGLEQVTALIVGSPAPSLAESWGWGREGERSIGLRFRTAADRAAFACQLERLRKARAAEQAASGKPGGKPLFSVTDASGKPVPGCRPGRA
jgi:hypothetical protein